MKSAGYSKTPLAKKLGMKDDLTVLLINQPEYYWSLFQTIPEISISTEDSEDIDFIHFFTKSESEFKNRLPELKEKINKNGMIWVSWPKKASKVETDLNDSIVREFGLSCGLVDVKVCAVDEIWSGLKFVYRLKDR